MSQEDKELHDPELSRLYQSGAHEQPTPELDEAILAHARAQTTELKRHRHQRHWIFSFATAAVLVLGLSLTLQLVEQDKEVPDILDDSYTPAAEKRLRQDESERKREAEVMEKTAPAAALPAMPATAPPPQAVEELESMEDAQGRLAPSEPAARTKSIVTEKKKPQTGLGAAQPKADVMPAEQRQSEPSAKPAPSKEMEADALEPPLSIEPQRMMEEESGYRGLRRESHESEARQAPPRAEGQSPPAAKEEKAMAADMTLPEDADLSTSPELWLEAITRLLEQGKEPQAREELQAFIVKYPDYPLPTALQALLSSE